MKAILIVAALLSSVSVSASAGEFDFDWNDKNDMRGAWFMCNTTGFRGDGCPEVYKKCWLPPMTYRKSHKTKTFCTDPPDFTSNDDDKNRALDEGSKRAKEMYGE